MVACGASADQCLAAYGNSDNRMRKADECLLNALLGMHRQYAPGPAPYFSLRRIIPGAGSNTTLRRRALAEEIRALYPLERHYPGKRTIAGSPRNVRP